MTTTIKLTGPGVDDPNWPPAEVEISSPVIFHSPVLGEEQASEVDIGDLVDELAPRHPVSAEPSKVRAVGPLGWLFGLRTSVS